MNFGPVVERELRLLARVPRTYYSRLTSALLATLISLGMLYAGFGGLVSAAAAGRSLFVILSWCAAAYVLVEGTLLTADCLSREKREGTLGLLFLTDLSGSDVVAGKLISRTTSSACGLLAALPVLGIALFLGGLGGRDFVQMMLSLLNGLFYAAAVGLCLSAASRRERQAFAATFSGVFGLSVLWPAVGWLLSLNSNSGSIHPVFLLISPAGAFWHVVNSVVWNTVPGYSFALALGLSHLIAWGFLLIGALILPHTWRETGARALGDALLNRPKVAKFATARARRRQRWLESHPMIWAADRPEERGGTLAPAAAVVVGAGLSGWVLLESNWFTLPLYVGLVILTHGVLTLLVMLVATRGPGQDRASGLLEILLTTPAGEDTYRQGRMLLIKRRCLGPVLLVLAAEFGLMAAGCWQSGALSWEWLGWIGTFLLLGFKLVLDLYVVSWVGFWQAVQTGRTGRALRRTLFQVFLLKWVILLGLLAALGIATQGRLFNTAAGGAITLGGYVVLWIATLVYACGAAVSDLQDHLRSMVLTGGEPVESRSGAWLRVISKPLRALIPASRPKALREASRPRLS